MDLIRLCMKLSVLTNKTVSKHFSNHLSDPICILVNVLIVDLFYLFVKTRTLV